MPRRLIAALILTALALGGCGRPVDTGPGAFHGRYQGVGTYPAGSMWSHIKVAPSPADPTAARVTDDEQVIVVVDSRTGELRQCGNLSGYCISMNPWNNLPRAAPAVLTGHATDEAAKPGTSSAAPTPSP